MEGPNEGRPIYLANAVYLSSVPGYRDVLVQRIPWLIWGGGR